MYFKKVTAAVLAALMCSTSISYEGLWKRRAQETEDKGLAVHTSENIRMEATNSLGNYITQVTQKQESEKQKMFNNAIAKDEFTILAMNFDIATGIFAIKTTQAAECTLRIRFLNDEDGKEFEKFETKLQRGKETISRSELDTNSLPEYFRIEVSLLGPMNECLCAPFVYKEYTREIQRIKATKIEDFEQEYVVNLDEKEDTNFVVLSEDTKVAASTATSNLLVSADYDNNVFVFENPDASMTELKKDDHFFSQPDAVNFIAVIVDRVEIVGNQATIYGSDDCIEDLFAFVKIEMNGEQFDWEGTPENVTLGNFSQELAASPIATECTASETTAAAESAQTAASSTAAPTTEDSIAAPTTADSSTAAAVTADSTAAALNTEASTAASTEVTAVSESAESSAALTEASAAPTEASEDIATAATETDAAPAESVEPASEAAVQTPEAQEIASPGIGNYQFYEGALAEDAAVSGGIDVDLGDFKISGSYEKSGDSTSAEMGLTIKDMFTIGLQMEETFEFYKEWDYTYSTMQLSVTATVGLEFSTDNDGATNYIEKLFRANAKEGWGEIEAPELPIPTPIAGLSFSFVPSVFLKLEGSIDFTFSVSAVLGFVYDSEEEEKFSIISCGPTIDPQISLKGEVQAGLALTLRAIVVNKRVFSVFVKGKFGSYATGEANMQEGHPDMEDYSVVVYKPSASKVHACHVCLKGEVGTIFGVEAGLEVFGGELSVDVYTKKWKWQDYYFCRDKLKFGFGECPHYSYRITIHVQDPEGNPLGETVELQGFDGATATLPLDDNGNAVFYCKQGKFNYKAYDGTECIEYGSFHVSSGGKTVYAIVGDDVYNGTEAPPATTKATTTTTTTAVTTATTNERQAEMACIENGQLGENVFFSLHKNGLMRIWGDGDMYDSCSIKNSSAVKSVNIENNGVDKITSIGANLFSQCLNLTKITMPDTITAIHDSAFWQCKNLESIDLPNELKYIGVYAFGGCSKLSGLVLPDKLETIDSQAFSGCSMITEIILPESVKRVENLAFSGCSSLKKAYIPSGVETLGIFLFDGSALEEITLPFAGTTAEGVANNDTETISKILFGGNKNALKRVTITGGTVIPTSAFNGLGSLTEVNLPDTITAIHDSAFWQCKNLESIDLPNELKYIGPYAFGGCSNLLGLVLPDKLETIDSRAFSGCSMITEIILPESVKRVEDMAFSGCSSLKKAYIPSGVETLGTSLFEGLALEEITLPFAGTTAEGVANNDTETISKILFGGNSNELKRVTITGGTTIPNNAFSGLASLKEVQLPDTITTIHECVFWNCYNLTNILMRGDAPEIASNAFSHVASVYYSKDNTTWTADKFRNYGGTITWVGIELPTITKHPESVYVKKGTQAKVVCSATGEELTYRWYYKDKGTYQYEPASGANTNTYTATMNEACNGRQVYCVVTDKYGNTVQTEAATLYMRTPLQLVAQTANASVYEGAKATITVDAIGDGLTYDWYYMNKSGIGFAHTSSFKTNTYAVEMTKIRDGRQVYCVVSDKYGNSVTTDVVTIHIKRCAEIISQPQDVYALNGRTANVTFDAVGDDLTYEWYVLNKGEMKFSDTVACRSSVYSVTMDSICDGRKVYCVITDKYGNKARTEIAKLVLGNPEDNPYELLTEKGKNAEIKLNIAGGHLTYKWYCKDKDADGFTHAEAFTTDTYSVTMDEKADGRQVYCVIVDKHGIRNQSSVYTLTMRKPIVITEQPQNVVAEDGNSVEVTFDATGDELIYKWYYRDAGKSSFTAASNFTADFYTAKMNAACNGREVYCQVIDRFGNSVRTDIVTLTMGNFAKILEQPKNVIAAKGEEAAVTVKASGDGLTYNWYYKNAGAARFLYTSNFKGETYSVDMSDARNGRQIYCVVTDQYGNSIKSDTVVLTMGNVVKLVEQPKSIKVGNGENAEIKLNVTGDGLKFRWYFMNAGKYDYKYTGTFTGNCYSTTMNAARDGRKIYCLITDKYGNSVKTNVVTLSMEHHVKLVEEPQNVSVHNGENARIALNVTGDGLTYKWYFKNPDSDDFKYTSTFNGKYYSITMNENRDGRQVFCVIKDEYGNTVKTQKVTLSMKKTVQLSEQPRNVVAPNGANAELTINATGDGLTYQWYFKNAGDTKFRFTSSFTDKTYSVAMSDARNGREIYCKITDAYGNTVETEPVTLIMGNPITIAVQPQMMTAAAGETVKTQVMASGDGLSYQWYYCDAGNTVFKLSSVKTNTYSAAMTAGKNGRQVYCEITDQYGVKIKTDIVTMNLK